MEFITSRGYGLPQEIGTMEETEWLHMWQKRNFPFDEVKIGDTLYWYDTKQQSFIWKSKIVFVESHEYHSKKKEFEQHKESLSGKSEEYYAKKPDSGYLVQYRIKIIERINIKKPHDFKFPRLGWLRLNNEISQLWFVRKV